MHKHISRGSRRAAIVAGNGALLATSVASILATGNVAMAAAAPAILEEIIVTAERRVTTEQTTAISMNVVSGDELAASRTQTVADLQATTPNVTINTPGPWNSLNIRGVGNSAIQPTITTGVAVMMDGLLNAETITLSNGFLDVGTIEILRGPQGTFIGASSTGGAIRVNSVKPDLSGKVSGYLEGLVAEQNNFKVTGAANLPVSDTFAARIAFNQEKRDSYFYSKGSTLAVPPANPLVSQGGVEDMNARVTLLWAPNDSFEATWRSEVNRSDNNGTPYQPNPRTFTNTLGVQTHSRFWNYDAPLDPTHAADTVSIDARDTRNRLDIERHSLEMNYKFGSGLTLRSLTGFVHNYNRYIEDFDGSFANALKSNVSVGPDNNYTSQEFNLISPDGPFNWIVGTNWFYRHTPVLVANETFNTGGTACGISSVDGSFLPCQPQFPTGPDAVPALLFVNSSTVARALGFFGQINWKFVDNLELTAGVRMNYDRNFGTGDGDFKPAGVQVVIPLAAGIVPGTRDCSPSVQASSLLGQFGSGTYSCLFIGGPTQYEENTPTWKLGLNWTPGDSQLLYAFWSRGYKSGGVDNQGQFERELVDDYELGWKGTVANGRVQLSIGGFYMDYQDMQQAAFRATAGSASAGNTVYNVGDSTIKGFEAELNAKLGGLGIQANVGYTDSKTGSVRVIDRTAALDSDVRVPGTSQDLRQCNPGEVQTTPRTTCVDWTPYYRSLEGAPNIYSPELAYGLTLSYELMAGNGTWTPRVSFSHTDRQDTNLIKREDYWAIPARNLANVSLTYTVNEWLAQLYCNNCADKTYIASVAGGGGSTPDTVIYGNPRNIGLRVRRSF
jgi:iron complex outermembrane recepter protein